MAFVEYGQSFGRYPVAVPVAQLRDGRLKPPLFDPEHYFFGTNAHCLSQSVQRKAVTADLADTQLPPLESVPKCLGTSVQPFGDLLHWEFGEEFPRFAEFFRVPSAVVGLGFDSEARVPISIDLNREFTPGDCAHFCAHPPSKSVIIGAE